MFLRGKGIYYVILLHYALSSHPTTPHYHPLCSMCYLQEITFKCEHVQKSLFMACKYAERLTRTTDGNAPEVCLQGFKVIRSTCVTEACGSSNENICDRLQAKALKPLFDRKMVIHNEIADCAKRICNVKACLDDGKRPLYNWQQVFEEGWNAAEEQRQQDTLWNLVLPANLEKVIAIFEDSCNEITTAYTVTFNEHFKQHSLLSTTGDQLALTMPPQPDWSIVDFIQESFLTQSGCAMFDEVAHAAKAKLHNEVLKLECLALEACMDDVGWTLPKDKYAKEVLEGKLPYRLVQPVEQSGTAVRETFVNQGHFQSMGPGHSHPEFEIEDDNMMDMAA